MSGAQLSAAKSGALSGVVRAPGDKSISHRSLIFGALATGTTTVEGLLEGEDVLRTAAAMRALGATVEQTGAGAWRVSGRGVGGLIEPADVLDMGNSGTAARLLCGLLAGHPIFAVMTGDASLRRRPMLRVTVPLSAAGATFWTREGGRLPLAVQGAAEALPLDYRLPVASAQVKSAILLAGLNTPGITRVIEPVATRDHSERMLRGFGADLTVEEIDGARLISIRGEAELKPQQIVVPGDPSSAAFPVVAAVIVPGSDIVVENVGLNPTRAGVFQMLRAMGADLTYENERVVGGEPVADIRARHSALTGIEVPADVAPSMIDEFPILFVAAAMARGRTTTRGLEELRVKESDRLALMARGLASLGIMVEESEDGLIIEGRGGAPFSTVGGTTIAAELDHRIAMSFAIAGLASATPVRIDDMSPVATSFPTFVSLMQSLGADV